MLKLSAVVNDTRSAWSVMGKERAWQALGAGKQDWDDSVDIGLSGHGLEGCWNLNSELPCYQLCEQCHQVLEGLWKCRWQFRVVVGGMSALTLTLT